MSIEPRLLQVERREKERRTPGPVFEGVRHLAVARLDRLGDVVLTFSAIAALQGAYPGAQLTLLVAPQLVPLAGMLPGVDRVVGVRPLVGDVAGAIREVSPDVIVCISREAALAWGAALARTPHRVGTGRRAWSPLFTRRVSEARRLGQRHELEYALSFAHRCGAGDPPESLALNTEPGREQALAWLERHGLDSGFLVIHAGSGGSCPPWPVPHFFELARLLAEEGWRIAFSVGPQELEVARLLDQAPPVLRHAPRLEAPLPVWAAVVQRAGAVVGNSTGPLHLAAALGCPAVGFYPPWPSCSAARWGPYSDRGWAIEARDEGALQWSAAERRARGSSLMSAMLPESVAPLVRRALLSATTARTAGSPPRAG